MRYSSTHKEEVREKLLVASQAIAKAGGFATTGVDALMSAIGLTGGAFYSHFPSKQALFEAVIEREMANSSDMLAGDGSSAPDHVAKRLRGYLSTSHATHPEQGCALPTLGAEISRAQPEVRKAVEACLKKVHDSWAERVDDSDAAWALIAQCVGALMLARSVDSDKTRKDILAANRRFIDAAHSLEHPLQPPSGQG